MLYNKLVPKNRKNPKKCFPSARKGAFCSTPYDIIRAEEGESPNQKHFKRGFSMLALLKLTQILPTLLIGMILVGAVAGESAVWGTGLILLILDAVVGTKAKRKAGRKSEDLRQYVG